MEPAAKASMQRREDTCALEWANLCDVRTNGNHWNGPIKQFRLTIREQAASAILSVCLDGELKSRSADLPVHAGQLRAEARVAHAVGVRAG
ncbi:DUF4424 family protein [Xanthomonas phaseoli]|uniref:DUF4424 family protein n=1 Tax=Xanthomonas phaseoli TaxID=1985254 RepID=UPI002B4B9981|nr:DUF4424 family protein [Xanthomonas phaseoli]MCC8470746.1 DUF4424 domain-containing protein [Xanthomonas phaseoli]